MLSGLPSSHTTAADLVQRIGSGDRSAEILLVQKYQRSLLEMLRNRTKDHDLAQDLLQDTLAIIIERLRGSGISEPHKLAAFIHRTAQNLAIAHFRKEARRDTHSNSELIELEPDQRSGQLQELLRLEESDSVRALLKQLPTARDREMLLRFYVWEQEKALICHEMGLSAEHFDRVISRARQRFRILLEPQIETLGARSSYEDNP